MTTFTTSPKIHLIEPLKPWLAGLGVQTLKYCQHCHDWTSSPSLVRIKLTVSEKWLISPLKSKTCFLLASCFWVIITILTSCGGLGLWLCYSKLICSGSGSEKYTCSYICHLNDRLRLMVWWSVSEKEEKCTTLAQWQYLEFQIKPNLKHHVCSSPTETP